MKPDRSGPPSDHEFGDASRRTYLAQERTLLAWWRTGLTTIAVALAIGKLLPAVARLPKGPFLWVGAGFGILALVFIVFGTIRQRAVSRALAMNRFAALDNVFVLALTAFMSALTLAVIGMLFWGA